MRKLILALMLASLGAAEARAQTTDGDAGHHPARLVPLLLGAGQPRERSDQGPQRQLVAGQHRRDRLRAVGHLRGHRPRLGHARRPRRERVRTTLETFWYGPQGSGTSGIIGYKGLFYHFLDMNTADADLGLRAVHHRHGAAVRRHPGLQAVLRRRGHDRDRASAPWPTRSTTAPTGSSCATAQQGIEMGWKPTTGFTTFGLWQGYNEAMILYLLALGSPTHPVPATTWTYWMSGYQWLDLLRVDRYVVFPPLFGHQYTHCWVDFRQRQDAFGRARSITYFENSRRATLAQRAYAIANPGGWVGYSDSLWGLTASDIKDGYLARGAPPALNDDGTITPDGAGRLDRVRPGRGPPGHPQHVRELPAAVGALRLQGRLQPEPQPGVVRHRPPGHRPGPHRAHDREPPHRPGVEPLHGEPRHPERAWRAPASRPSWT